MVWSIWVADVPIWLSYFGVCLVGLSVGSFLNVVIYRCSKNIPNVELGRQSFFALIWGRSHCGACRAPLRWHDLIPVFSWVVSRGRCRYCGVAVSAQYPIIEILVGALFVVFFGLYGWSSKTAGFVLMALNVIAISGISVRSDFQDKRVLFFLPASAFFFSLMGWGNFGLWISIISGLLGWLFLHVMASVLPLWRMCEKRRADNAVVLAGIAAWLGFPSFIYLFLFVISFLVMLQLVSQWSAVRKNLLLRTNSLYLMNCSCTLAFSAIAVAIFFG